MDARGPVLQPLVAPPRWSGLEGLDGILAPIVAPPATAGLSELLPSALARGARLDRLESVPLGTDGSRWLLSSAFGLLLLVAGGHVARAAGQRNRAGA